jgi:AcrR family transcriptional regulator
MVVVEELLSHKRLDELQVNDIVAAAMISRPTFYAHFDTKYSVVAVQIRTMGAAIFDLWAPLFDGSGPIRHDVVLGCARATISSWRERSALCIAATEGWHSNAEIHEAWNPVILQFNKAATERIARTDLALNHPEATAAALVSMFERCMYSTVAVPDSPLFDADETLAEVMAAIWTKILS